MRRRIVTLVVLAAVLAIALFGVPLAIGAALAYRNDEITELERLADAAAIAVSGDLVQGQVPDLLPAADGESALGLYDAAGLLIRGRGPAQADAAVRRASAGDRAHETLSGELVVAVPVSEDGQVVAIVRSATPRSQLYLRTATTWALMLGLALVAVAVTWLIARRQAGRLAAPMTALSTAARELGAGNFGVRTARSGIVEIDSVAESLDSTADRLGSLLSRERSFSADASHQLRTPLTGLRLRLEAALTDSREIPTAVRAGLADIDRLERTIEDLLSLRRGGGVGHALRTGDLVADVQADWHALLAAQGRPLRVVIDADLPPCTASAPAVRQILGVLLDNALRHGAGVVSVTVRDAGGATAIDVADDGAGLPAGPSSTAVPGGRAGRGLDLATVLAEAQGGRLLARPGSARVTLLLPASPTSAHADDAPEQDGVAQHG